MCIIHRGNSLQDLGRHQESIVHYQEALRIKPNYANAHYDWGNALHALGRYQEAIVHHQVALRIKLTGITAVDTNR